MIKEKSCYKVLLKTWNKKTRAATKVLGGFVVQEVKKKKIKIPVPQNHNFEVDDIGLISKSKIWNKSTP